MDEKRLSYRLDRSGLSIENGRLVKVDREGRQVASYPLAEIKAIARLHPVSPMKIALGILFVLAGVIAQQSIESWAWAWLLLVMLAGLGAFLLLGARDELLVVSTPRGEFPYDVSIEHPRQVRQFVWAFAVAKMRAAAPPDPEEAR